MGKIFYIIGQSSTGKDTLYKEVLKEMNLNLCTMIPYTTRPIRKGEVPGVEYHFVDDDRFDELRQSGKVIESRAYNTVHGVWQYFTVCDDDFSKYDNNYLMIGVLESYIKTAEYYGSENVVPIYIHVEDGERLQRALNREKKQANPRYKEMCRRYIADLEDFSEGKLLKAGITKKFENNNLDECVGTIVDYIKKEIE